MTNKHLNRILKQIGDKKQRNMFGPSRNLVCYRLSKLSRNRRGKAAETYVKDILTKKGHAVKHIGNSNRYDLYADKQKIEVKSALAIPQKVRGRIEYTYKFGHVCPAKFDKLVMVYISPNGLELRTMDSRTAAKRLGTRHKHKSLYAGYKKIGKVLAT